MKIEYQDEYGEVVYRSNENSTFVQLPNVSDTIVIGDEDWRVKSRIFHPVTNMVVIVIAQSVEKSNIKEHVDSSGRLNELNRAILALSNRQDIAEKKGRMLTEQVGTIRKHINQRIQQERKDT